MDPRNRLLQQTAYLPNSIQDRLAADIAAVYRLAWEAAGKPLGSPQAYFDANPAARQMVRQSMAAKSVPWAAQYGLDIAPLLSQDLEVPRVQIGQYAGTAQQVRGIGQSGRLGQLEELLARSAYGSLDAMVAKRQQMSGFVSSEEAASQATAAYLGVAERLPSFEPDRGSFMAFATQRAGQGAVESERRSDLAARPYGTQSLDALLDAGEELADADELQTGSLQDQLEIQGYASPALAAAQSGPRVSAFAVRSDTGFTTVRKTINEGLDAWGPKRWGPVRVAKKLSLPDEAFEAAAKADDLYSLQRSRAQEAYSLGYDQRTSAAQMEIFRKQQAIRQSSAKYFQLPTRGTGTPILDTAVYRRYPDVSTATIDPFIPLSRQGQMAVSSEKLWQYAHPDEATLQQLRRMDAAWKSNLLYHAPVIPGVVSPVQGGRVTAGREAQGLRHNALFQMQLPSGEMGYFSAIGRPRFGKGQETTQMRYKFLGVGEVDPPARYWQDAPSQAIPRHARMIVDALQGGGYNLAEDTNDITTQFNQTDDDEFNRKFGEINPELTPAEMARAVSASAAVEKTTWTAAGWRGPEFNVSQMVRDSQHGSGVPASRMLTPVGSSEIGSSPADLGMQPVYEDVNLARYIGGNLSFPVSQLLIEQITRDPEYAAKFAEANPQNLSNAESTRVLTGYELSYGQDVGERNVVQRGIIDEQSGRRETIDDPNASVDEERAAARATAGPESARFYQQIVGQEVARTGRVGGAKYRMPYAQQRIFEAVNASGLAYLERADRAAAKSGLLSASKAPPNLDYWKGRIARQASRNAPRATASAATKAESVGAALTIPPEMLPQAAKAAAYWSEMASWMAGEKVTVKPYTGQVKTRHAKENTPAFYLGSEDTIYITKPFFQPELYTPERMRNIGSNLAFEDLGGRFISHEVGHRQLRMSGYERILHALKSANTAMKARRTRFMAGIAQGEMSDEWLAKEIGAEMFSRSFGYASPMVEETLGKEAAAVQSAVLNAAGDFLRERVPVSFPGWEEEPEMRPLSEIDFDEVERLVGDLPGSEDGGGGGPPEQPPVDLPEEPEDPKKKSNSEKAGLSGGRRAQAEFRAKNRRPAEASADAGAQKRGASYAREQIWKGGYGERHLRLSEILHRGGAFDAYLRQNKVVFKGQEWEKQAQRERHDYQFMGAATQLLSRAANDPTSLPFTKEDLMSELTAYDDVVAREEAAEVILEQRGATVDYLAAALGMTPQEFEARAKTGELDREGRRIYQSLNAAGLTPQRLREAGRGASGRAVSKVGSETALKKYKYGHKGKGFYGRTNAEAGFYLINEDTGESLQMMSPQHLGNVLDTVEGPAASDAFSTSLPDHPKAALMTLKARMNKFVNDYLNKVEKEMIALSDDPHSRVEASTVRAYAGKVAQAAINAQLQSYEKEMQRSGLETTGWRQEAATRLAGAKAIEAGVASNPALGEKIKTQFGSLGAAARAAPTTIEAGGQYYTVGDLGIETGGVGGEGGVWDPRRQGASRFFGQGGVGSALYGAYLAKRMIAMTVGPSVQEAEYYAGKVAEPASMIAAGGGGVAPLGSSYYGSATRASLMKDTFARGAYEQWGGVIDAQYALFGGNTSLARAGSGVGAGIAVAGLGAIAPGLLGTLGLEALGAAAAPILTTAGLTIAGGSLAMEAYNAYLKPENMPDASWGWMAKTGTNMWDVYTARTQYYQNMDKPGAEALRQSGAFGRNVATFAEGAWKYFAAPWTGALTMFGPDNQYVNLMQRLGIDLSTSEDEVLAYMTPEQRALYRMEKEGPSPEVSRTIQLAEGLKGVTGEEIAQVAPNLRQMLRYGGGGLDTGKMLEAITQGWIQYGATGSEQAQRWAQAAEQLGYRPGGEAGGLREQFFYQMSEDERIRYAERAGQVARYGGSLSGFFRDAKAGQRLADTFDIRTQMQTGGVQSLLSTATSMGATGDTIVGADSSGLGVSLGTRAAELAQKYGPYRSGLAAQLAQPLMTMGVHPLEAIGAFGALGFSGQTQVSSALQLIETAKLFGTQANPLDIAGAAVRQNAWQTQVMGGMAQQMAVMGNVDIGQAQAAFSGLGLSNRQMWLWQRMAGGDLSALSWNARQTGSAFGLFQNEAGIPIYQTSMAGFITLNNAQYNAGNPYAVGLNGTARQQLAQLLPTADEEALDAYMTEGPQGGMVARSLLHTRRMLSFQQRSLDLSQQQADTGWAHEQRGWALQDQQRAMQRQFQMADFSVARQRMGMEAGFAERQEGLSLNRLQMSQGFAERGEALQWQQMTTGWRYAEQGENLSWQRMLANNQFAERGEALGWQRIQLQEQYGGRVAQLGRERMLMYHENQLWGLQFARGSELLQRGFTQEQWSDQDTARSLQRGWATEDINEQIRFATGRQRAQLVRQRERQNMMSSLEEESIEKGRTQQEQMWAREDERYAKQEEFLNRVIALDKQQYELAEEQRSASIALEKEEWQLSRERRLSNLDFEKQEWQLGRERRLDLMAIDTQQYHLQVEQRKAFAALDLEQHNLSVERRKAFYQLEQRELERRISEYQQQFDLQTRILEEERTYQRTQRQFQLENFKLQKEQMQEQAAYAIETEKVSRLYQGMASWTQEMAKNDPSFILKALSEVAKDMSTVSPTVVEAIQRMLKAINGVDQGSLQQLMDVLITMES